MEQRIPVTDIEKVVQAAQNGAVLVAEDTSVVFYDMDRLRARCVEACDSFGADALHAVAVKANPLPSVLSFFREVHPQIGAEAASLPELHLALAAGFSPERIVFDSPAKTVDEIRAALELGVHLNIDNFQELERVANAVEAMPGAPTGAIGFRVNPQVGAGAIASTSVAGEFSKFGVPLTECRDALLQAFGKYPWLTAVHAHVGSQGCSVDQLVEGAKAIVAFAGECERITTIDIGGGLPATYCETDCKPAISEYASALRESVPELFSGKYRILTEFGRAINANSAFAASRVEYVKEHSGIRVAVNHLGADMFIRKCYNPSDWHHDMVVLTAEGHARTEAPITQSVAGPLCFQGDFIARDVPLAPMEQGDWIIIRDAGAYTLCMWSRYNSRSMPAVLGFSRTVTGVDFCELRKRESVQDVLDFWS